jgi:acyl-CoA synthetase (AMP-forming)/AMP-acid ligase II
VTAVVELLTRFAEFDDAKAFISKERTVSYAELAKLAAVAQAECEAAGVTAGDRVVVECEFGPDAVALFVALITLRCVLIPISRDSVLEIHQLLDVSGADWTIYVEEQHSLSISAVTGAITPPPLLKALVERGNAGFVLFSSGSTGQPKGMVYDFEKIALKFLASRRPPRSIPFLMVDHFGGINTLFSVIFSGGEMVVVKRRNVEEVCWAIENFQVALLPTTPSFLNLMLVRNAVNAFDLSSLQKITYGTEVMMESTLVRLKDRLPNVTFQQTYGLSEVGVLRTKSRDDTSLWLKMGGEGFDLKIIDDVLWIKSDNGMDGYLNADVALQDGWFCTQDLVEVEGDFIKILGRSTDIINVGGQKVYPAEVENSILEVSGIEDVVVFGQQHNLLGQVVACKIRPTHNDASLHEIKRTVRRHLKEKLLHYKIPVVFTLADGELVTARQKKSRKNAL